jgi:hypothetical protein
MNNLQLHDILQYRRKLGTSQQLPHVQWTKNTILQICLVFIFCLSGRSNGGSYQQMQVTKKPRELSSPPLLKYRSNLVLPEKSKRVISVENYRIDTCIPSTNVDKSVKMHFPFGKFTDRMFHSHSSNNIPKQTPNLPTHEYIFTCFICC